MGEMLRYLLVAAFFVIVEVIAGGKKKKKRPAAKLNEPQRAAPPEMPQNQADETARERARVFEHADEFDDPCEQEAEPRIHLHHADEQAMEQAGEGEDPCHAGAAPKRPEPDEAYEPTDEAGKMSVNSEAIRVVIADDEPGMRMIMRKMIEKAEGFTLCGEADNGPDLLKLVERYKPQVCFLDVEMPGMTGLECAKAIQDTDPRTILVFATAHDDYMAQAFEVYAFDYMVKPFKVERVMKTLERIRQVVGGRAQSQSEETGKLEEHLKTIPTRGASSGRIMLHHKEGVNFINQSDILLVQRENRSTVLYATGGRRFETSEALGDVEARLDPKIFFRCHKSYIINLNVIDNITPYGRWTYVVHLVGTTQDALITHEKYEELEKMFS